MECSGRDRVPDRGYLQVDAVDRRIDYEKQPVLDLPAIAASVDSMFDRDLRNGNGGRGPLYLVPPFLGAAFRG